MTPANEKARVVLALLAARPLASAVHAYGGGKLGGHAELPPHTRGGYITARAMSNHYGIEYGTANYWLGRLTTNGLAEKIKSDATYYRITEAGMASLLTAIVTTASPIR